MSKFKRFVSTMATAAILISGISIPSFAALPSDVIGTDYEEAAKVLGAFEIMVGDGSDFRPNDTITRSEVTKVAVALKGLSGVANTQTATKFPDVREGHWATGYINVGTSEELVFGDGEGNFRPDDIITYNEAVTILVRALGYEPQAKSKGGYPGGYLSAGNSTGLTSGVTVAAARSRGITRGQVAQLAYNALDIKTMEQVGFGDNAKFEVTDETLANAAHNAEKIEGMVSAIGSSALQGSGVERGEIVIDGKTYKTGDADVRNILGLNVDAYIVNGTKGKKTVKVIVPSYRQNSITTIQAEDLDSVTGTGTKTITYFNGSKKNTITVGSDSFVVYNGMAGTLNDIALIDAGNIMVAENDGDKKTVFVNETENLVVDEVILTSNRVTDKYGKSPITLDADDKDVTFVIDKNGRTIGIEDLKEWNVMTLTMSRDKSIIYADVSDATVEGKVTEIDDNHIYVGGQKLAIAPDYTENIKLGDEGVFHLDSHGKVAALSRGKAESKNYAYLTNLGIKSGLGAKLEIELLTLDGKVATYTAANKIKVDNKTYSSHTEAMNAIGSKGQLVTAELNSDGKISKIEKSTQSSEIDEDSFHLNFTEDDVKFNGKTSTLLANAMNVRVDANTVVFDIPASSTNTDDYSVSGKDFFADEAKYDVSVYDVTEDLTAGVVIVTSSENKASEDSSIIVVDKLASSKDEDGKSIEKLYGYQNGERVSYTADNGTFKKGSSQLENGDIIQVKSDAKGHVKAISVLFDSDNTQEFSTDISENLTVLYGKVTKKFASSFNLSVNDGTSKNYIIGDASVYVVDTSKKQNTISVGDASDIQKYDDANPEKVFVRIYKDEVKDIVIVK